MYKKNSLENGTLEMQLEFLENNIKSTVIDSTVVNVYL